MNSMQRRWQAIGLINRKPPLHAFTSCSCWFTAFPANKWAPPAPFVPQQRCSGFLRPTPLRLNQQQQHDVGTLLNANDPAKCPDLLLDQSQAAEKVVAFLEENEVVTLRGQPASGKTWLISAVVDAAKKRKHLWSSVDVVDPDDFVAHMNKLKKSRRPRPLVIVDEAHIVWAKKADRYIEKLQYADFLFVTTASHTVANRKTVTPEVSRAKQLWLSSVTTDPDVVKEWITRLVNRATTKRSDNDKARLIEYTFAICGGHIGRTVAFLAEVLEKDGIRVPLDVFDSERSVTGGNGEAIDVFEMHPLACQIFTDGSAMIDPGDLRSASGSAAAELLTRIRLGFFVPVESWTLKSSLAPIKQGSRWSMGSAPQRDYVTRRFTGATFEAPAIKSPLDMLLHALPFWRTDLLFVRDEEVKRSPFLEKHVHQAFIAAHEQLCARCPSIDTRIIYEKPVASSARGHPKSLDFVVHVDTTGKQFGVEFLIDGSFESHHKRFRTDYADLNLDDHLTVYFEADKNHTKDALKFVEKTPGTCVVQPSPVRGWDAFHVTYNDRGEKSLIIVPRVGGVFKMFIPV